MLDLTSPQWADITASLGGNGILTAQLLQRLSTGDESAWPELYHQVCHQNSVSEAAYLATPHLVAIASGTTVPRFRALVLGTIGTIVASIAGYSISAAKLREEWKTEFDLACAEARTLAAEALKLERLDLDSSLQLIITVAALHGHYELALLLQGGPRFTCPECGEYLAFGDSDDYVRGLGH